MIFVFFILKMFYKITLVFWTEKRQKPCLHFLKLPATLLVQFYVFMTKCARNNIIRRHGFCEKHSNRVILIFIIYNENRLILLNLLMSFSFILFHNLFDILYNTDLNKKSFFDISRNICFYYKLSGLIKFDRSQGSGLLWKFKKKHRGVADLAAWLTCS